MTLRGRPLSSHEIIVNSIAATTTKTGLTVRAELDTGEYPTGVRNARLWRTLLGVEKTVIETMEMDDDRVSFIAELSIARRCVAQGAFSPSAL